jgi:hypothetical protein
MSESKEHEKAYDSSAVFEFEIPQMNARRNDGNFKFTARGQSRPRLSAGVLLGCQDDRLLQQGTHRIARAAGVHKLEIVV